jgi:hypothetical protein
MATVVTLGAITTADAAPTTAPHKISNKATKDAVSIPFTVAGSGAVRAWSVRFGATSIKLAGQGMVCGEARCGIAQALARALGATITATDTYGQLPSSADGSYTVNVRAYSDDGWA